MPGVVLDPAVGGSARLVELQQTLGAGNLMLLYPPIATSPAAPQPAPPALPVVPVPPNDRNGAELSVTTDAAEDSAPQAVVVPAEAAPVGDR